MAFMKFKCDKGGSHGAAFYVSIRRARTRTNENSYKPNRNEFRTHQRVANTVASTALRIHKLSWGQSVILHTELHFLYLRPPVDRQRRCVGPTRRPKIGGHQSPEDKCLFTNRLNLLSYSKQKQRESVICKIHSSKSMQCSVWRQD